MIIIIAIIIISIRSSSSSSSSSNRRSSSSSSSIIVIIICSDPTSADPICPFPNWLDCTSSSGGGGGSSSSSSSNQLHKKYIYIYTVSVTCLFNNIFIHVDCYLFIMFQFNYLSFYVDINFIKQMI